MNNWQEYKLDELCEVGRGSSPRPIIDQRYFEGGKIPWIKIADATASGKYIYETKEHVNEYGASFSRYLDPDSLIIAASGVSLGQIKFLGVKGCIHDGWLYTSKFNSDIILKEFLYYFLIFYSEQFHNFSSGAAIQNINTEILRNTKVPCPPIEAQKKTASILSSYDALIENNNQRITLLEDMATEIYKEWFVRFRFPKYQNTRFLDKDGKVVAHGTKGAIPEGWDMCKVSDYGNVITGKTPSKNDDSNFDGAIPFIKTPDMGQGMFFTKTDESLSEKGANSQKNQFVPENSICISCIGTVGKLAITTTLSQTNQQINSITPKEDYYLQYLYFSFLRLKPVIESYAATGATMANLSKSKFENLKLLKPTDELIEEYSNIVSSFFEEIKILLQKNKILQETRDLLLPRLISGKLSVEDLEVEEMNMAAEPQEKYSK